MGRVVIMNAECTIVTTTTTTAVTTTTTTLVSTTTTTLDWSDCTQCPPGYEAVAQGCIQYDEVAATYTGTTYTIVKKTADTAYTVYGGLMFSLWNYDGTGTFERFGVTPVNSYWSNLPYKNPGTLGVMNRTSVWASTTTNNQDIGFQVCIDIDIPKTYYIGVGCDNYAKIKLNGTMILEQSVTALKSMFGSLGMSSPYDDAVTFKYWYVYPVYFPQGQNIVEVFGHNVESVAGVGIEIYDATPAEIMSATSDADLAGKFIFRSQDLEGQTLFYEYSTGGGFHGYSCAEGYALSTCGETVMCVKRDFIPCQGGTTTTTTAIPLTTTSTTVVLTTTTTVIPATTTTTAALVTTTTTTTAIPVTTTTTTETVSLITGLVSVWELNETTGTTIEDSHGANDGTLYNTPTLNVSGVTNLTPAITFASTSTEYAGADTGIVSAYPISVSLWAKTTQALTDQAALIFIGNMLASNAMLVINMRNDGGANHGANILTYNGAAISNCYSEVDVNDGNWHHIVAVWSSSTLRSIYVDGVFKKSETTLVNIPTINRWNLARMGRSSPVAYYNGTLDQVVVWNKALNQSEITTLYNSGNGFPYASWEGAITTTTTTLVTTTTTTTAAVTTTTTTSA